MLVYRSDFGKPKQPPYLNVTISSAAKQRNKLQQFQFYLAVVVVSLNTMYEEIIDVSNITF